MREHADLYRRLDATVARLRGSDGDEREVEDLLTEGYARALAGEAESRHLELQLAQLLPDMDKPAVAKEARRLALQRRTVDTAVADLRARLARLSETLTGAHERPSASA